MLTTSKFNAPSVFARKSEGSISLLVLFLLSLSLFLFSALTFAGFSQLNFLNYGLGALTIGFGVARLFVYRKKIRPQVVWLLVFPFLFCISLIVLALFSGRATFFFCGKCLFYFALFAVVCCNNVHGDEWKGMIRALYYSLAAVIAVYLIALIPHLLCVEKWRFGDFFGGINFVARICSVFLAVSLFLLRKKQASLLVSLFFGFLLGFMTGSRQFLFASGIMIAGFVFFACAKKQYPICAFSLLLVLVSFGIAHLLSGFRLFDRLFLSTLSVRGSNEFSIEDISVVGRLDFIKRGWKLFLLRPVSGFGPDGFVLFSGFFVNSHCNPIELLADYGVFGFLFFYSAWIPLVVKFLSRRRQESIIFLLVLSLVLLLEFSFCSVFFSSKIYWALAGCLGAVANREPNRTQQRITK